MRRASIVAVALVCVLSWFSERASGEQNGPPPGDRVLAALTGFCRCTCSTAGVENGPIWERLETVPNTTSRPACSANAGLYCWIDEPHPSNISHIGKRRNCRWFLGTAKVPNAPPAAVKPKQSKPGGVVP